MTKLEQIQTQLQILERTGHGNSAEYKRLRAQVQVLANDAAYDEGPSLSSYKVCHVWGHTPKRRQKSA